MKRIFTLLSVFIVLCLILVGCTITQKPVENGGENASGKRLEITMTIAETLPSCVAFEYKDEKPYCFYAYDAEGRNYRVFWTDFSGLNEGDVVIVDHNDDIRTLTYDEYPDGGWTPQYEVTAIKIRMKKRANENLVTHIQIKSGERTIFPFGCLLWSKIDNEDGTYTETMVDKYDVVDLVSGKTSFPVTDIPNITLDERVAYFVQANGMVERVYLISSDGSRYTKTETTFDALSDLAEGTYYVVLEVLLDGNCDPDAPQNSYRYEDVFCLVVAESAASGSEDGAEKLNPPVSGRVDRISIDSIDKVNYFAARRILTGAMGLKGKGGSSSYDIALLKSTVDTDKKEELTVPSTTAPYLTEGPDVTDPHEPQRPEGEIYYYSFDPDQIFYIGKVSMFNIELTDENGFLASELGLGTVEVVITDGFIWGDALITFRNGERFFSCLANGWGMNEQSGASRWDFSTHKYIEGFNIVKNFRQENCAFYIDMDADGQVISFECQGSQYADKNVEIISSTIISADGGSFTADELENYFNSKSTL